MTVDGKHFIYCLKINCEKVKTVDIDKLIKAFSDMAERESLLCGRCVTQEDLLIQIIGTIVKVSMNLFEIKHMFLRKDSWNDRKRMDDCILSVG